MNVPARFELATLPTPLARARRPGLVLKRDDLSGFAAAGHKARQLEFLVGAARARDCDVVVTGGGPGSNFCAAAATAAAIGGLDCEIVYYGAPPASVHPNLAAAWASGARTRFTGDPDRAHVDSAVADVARDLEEAGRRPYAIPRGGATPVGAIGMVLAVEELAAQLDELQVDPAAVVVATGSGGACAGVLVGTALSGRDWRVVGAAVSRPLGETDAQVRGLARDCATVLGVTVADMSANLDLVDARGPGFGVASEEGERAACSALRDEGLLLDPVYTAKAFAVALRRLDDGPVVFWHTGGVLAAAHHLETRATNA
ncbi:MAG: 1-aminocyclopropane-1-carboxylate deaminase/D-cysteine desulfhydrase [Acidimicrobiales bacterium]